MRLGQTRALQAYSLLHAHSQLNLARLHESGAVSLSKVVTTSPSSIMPRFRAILLVRLVLKTMRAHL